MLFHVHIKMQLLYTINFFDTIQRDIAIRTRDQ